MKCRVAVVVFLGLCAVQEGRADLTMRHTFTVEFGSLLPPQAVDAIKQQLGDRMAEGTTVQIKGDRVYTSMGQMFSVTDYAKGEITLVDPKTKHFATVPLAEFPAKILAAQKLPTMAPDAQRIFDNMRLEVKNSKTGQTATIHGIGTEENLLVISMEVTTGMQMRTEIHNSGRRRRRIATDAGAARISGFFGRPKGGPDPVEMVTKSLAGLPGIGEKLRGPMQEMMKGAGKAVIRMRAATYMPAMARALGGSADDEPITEVVMDLAELSAEPIADSRFEVPEGYQRTAMEDLLGTIFPVQQLTPPGGPKTEHN